MAGRDYVTSAAWALTLSTHNSSGHTNHHHVTQVAVWLAPTTNVTSSSTSRRQHDVVPADASVTMQWIAHTPSSSSDPPHLQQQHLQQQRRRQWPQVSLGLLQLLLPLQRPEGGPMLLQINLQQQLLRPLQQLLALRVTPQATPPLSPGSSSSNSSSTGSCWQPVVVYSSIWGGQQHSLVLNTTLAAADAAVARGWIGWAGNILAPWFAAAGPKVSKLPGSAAAVYTQLQLSQVSAGSSGGGSSSSSSTLLLLLDPSCGYQVSLGWDIVGAGALLLLRHGSTAAGIAVALLLLVLSHQMSSLIRVMSVARHGTAATHSGATAAVAAAGGGGSSITSPLTRSSSPSQLQRQYSHRQQQLLSSSSSRRRTPSPTSAAAAAAADGQDGGGGAGFIPSLPSPAASVARRLVQTSSDYSDDGYNMSHDRYNNDSDSEGAALPLLGIQQQQQQQQQQRQQPSVAGPHSFLNLSFSGGVTGGGITLEQSAAGATSDAEWGLGEDDSVGVLIPKPQTAVSAMQRFRRQITITLGGAPPPVEQQIAAATTAAAAAAGDADSSSGSNSRAGDAGRDSSRRGQQGLRTLWAGRFRAAAFPWALASSNGVRAVPNNSSSSDSRHHQQQQQRRLQRVHGGWSGVGISVLGSLVAVTGDLRVLLLAGLLSAAAAGLNTLNPDSIWNSSSSRRGVTHHPYSSSSSGSAYWLLQQLLSVVGLAQRGDSPGVVGCGVLLGLALLVLLVAVGVSWALKWLLDYVTAAVAAFNRWVGWGWVRGRVGAGAGGCAGHLERALGGRALEREGALVLQWVHIKGR